MCRCLRRRVVAKVDVDLVNVCRVRNGVAAGLNALPTLGAQPRSVETQSAELCSPHPDPTAPTARQRHRRHQTLLELRCVVVLLTGYYCWRRRYQVDLVSLVVLVLLVVVVVLVVTLVDRAVGVMVLVRPQRVVSCRLHFVLAAW